MATEETKTTQEPIEQKLPSPEEIKKGPVKFTPEEIERLKNYQAKLNNLVYNLGQLKYTQIQLDAQEEMMKGAIMKAKEEEKQIADNLSQKYGQGQLDIESGTFIPTE
tara:strand:+ start:139 stop:462 length:324 start_codon:yes stop_codon:yes gene_type:complete